MKSDKYEIEYVYKNNGVSYKVNGQNFAKRSYTKWSVKAKKFKNESSK